MSRLILLLSISLVFGAEPATWTMSPDQRHAITALVDQAVALGLPDGRGATLIQGFLENRHDSNDCECGFLVHLANGLWVAPGRNRRPDEVRCFSDWQRIIKVAPLPVLLKQLHLDGMALPSVLGDPFATGCFPQASQAMVDALRRNNDGRTLCQRIWHPDRFTSGRLALYTAVLIRAGVPEAEWLAVESALFQGREHPLGTAPLILRTVLDDGIEPPPCRRDHLPDPIDALRQGLAEWFRSQFLDTDDDACRLTPERAWQGWMALAPDDDPVIIRDRERLQARLTLPRTVVTDAELAARLSAWCCDLPRPDAWCWNDLRFRPCELAEVERCVRLGRDQIWLPTRLPDVAKDRMHARLLAQVNGRLTPAHLHGLIALTGDTRPSRWLDGEVPRTIGDQALRAMHSILFVDPRRLVGRDPAMVWSDEERTATAQALAGWWAANRSRPLTELVLDSVSRLSATEIDDLLQCHQDAVFRDAVLDRVAGCGPDAAPDGDIAGLLVRGRNHAGFAARVDAWQLNGRHADLLRLWHALRGRPEQLERMLLDVLATVPDQPRAREPYAPWGTAIWLAAHLATPALVTRLQAMLPGEHAGMILSSLRLGMHLHQYHHLHVRFWKAMTEDQPRWDGRAGTVNRMVIAQLLQDQRPKSILGGYLGSTHQQEATDLRVADVAASWLFLPEDRLPVPAHQDVPPERRSIDLTKPRAERDQVIAEIADHLRKTLPEHMQSAGLPLTIPGFELPQVQGASSF